MTNYANIVESCNITQFRTEVTEDGRLSFFRHAVPKEEGRLIGILIISENRMDRVSTADPTEMVDMAMAARRVVSVFTDHAERVDIFQNKNMLMAFDVIDTFFPASVLRELNKMKGLIKKARPDDKVKGEADAGDGLCFHLVYDVHAAELAITLSTSDDPDDPDLVLFTVSYDHGAIFSFRRHDLTATTLAKVIKHLQRFHAALDLIEDKWVVNSG